jgi:acyl-[acyl-carrier-protein]-phospholipid O-acyltransferase/long-chain-fatty-acid--[acyl-carrier-protein] ligase
VTVSFGAPMASSASAQEVRQAIQELSADATAHRVTPRDTLPARLMRVARRNWRRLAMADSTGRQLMYGEMLTGAMLVGRACPGAPREMVGVILPPTVAGALVNLGLTVTNRVPVNLNFTAGRESMQAAIAQCEIRSILTSRIFVKKLGLELAEGVSWIYVEDLLKNASGLAKVRAYLAARFFARTGSVKPDDVATVIFSSGSTGVPKGVLISHYNVIANVEAIAQMFWIAASDRIVGVLPFFHSFGFTVTIWFPMLSGCGVVYHPNPTEASAIGELVAQHKGTLLLSTPTFCATYTRKCTKEQFASLRYVLVGAERLRESIGAAFREKFGVELLEGYGCTEMSPVVAVNVPTYEAGKDTQIGNKPGTVGHPLPGVAARIVDAATFEPLAPNTEGLLLVKGSNRMIGYLKQPERTAEVLHDGWYITGDIALEDDEGFIKITDRLSRFSKIGGEMVPHLKVEEAILAALGTADAHCAVAVSKIGGEMVPHLKVEEAILAALGRADAHCAVAGVPDEQRGERLVALYVQPDVSPAELWQRLNASDLPRLWVPKRENLYQVGALPQLGTGKLDLRGVKQCAQALMEQTAGLPSA